MDNSDIDYDDIDYDDIDYADIDYDDIHYYDIDYEKKEEKEIFNLFGYLLQNDKEWPW